jgi:hypothetical protein
MTPSTDLTEDPLLNAPRVFEERRKIKDLLIRRLLHGVVLQIRHEDIKSTW